MSNFGFSKREKPKLGAGEIAKRIKPVPLDNEAEERAAKAGEAKGFVSREQPKPKKATPSLQKPVEDVVVGRRRRPKVPQGKILVTGPAEVLDRFAKFADDNDHSSYWKALEALLDGQKK